MNSKTAKLLSKYSQRKDIPEKELKREWLSFSHTQKAKKAQEILAELAKK